MVCDFFQGWLLGYQLAFDSGKSKLTKNNFALGYTTGDFVIHTNVNDGQVGLCRQGTSDTTAQ